MARQLVECVPNFSEGRDAGTIDAIDAAIRSVTEVALLDRQSDRDHHRSVFTFAGPPAATSEAAFRSIATAAARIDLTAHQGAHPRIGAADVVPFVPLEGVTLEDCAQLAHGLGRRVWDELKVPVYFYGAAATRRERVNLEDIRRGQFEALLGEMPTVPGRAPDCGEPRCHPTAGATAIGARRFLIAYNINLATSDVAIARRIAKTIRASSGGLSSVKAMGVMLASRGIAQVSMNLTDFERTPMHVVFEAVRQEAERCGVAIAGSEIVGLAPRKAMELSAAYFLRVENFRCGLILENRLDEALAARAGLPEVAAAASAALGARLARLAGQDAAAFDDDRRFFTAAAGSTASAEFFDRARALKARLDQLAAPEQAADDLALARALADALLR